MRPHAAVLSLNMYSNQLQQIGFGLFLIRMFYIKFTFASNCLQNKFYTYFYSFFHMHILFHKGAQTGKLIVGKNYNLRCKLALTALRRKVYIKSNGTKVLLHALFFYRNAIRCLLAFYQIRSHAKFIFTIIRAHWNIVSG